ncbi:hypothetical protein DL770_006464 [Monosporascus sp. CRB-9-2]|nr:hypothetical protein DL770_006464 [Monosporascus sp. CRB-9-2]
MISSRAAMKRKRSPSDEMGRKVHEKHSPHRSGRPPGNCNRFPGPYYIENGGDEDNLEVVGLNDFVHVRCPFASPKACPCGRYACHLDSMIVAVDGACPGNGSDLAVRSACGVYFGPEGDDDGPRNMALRIPDEPGVLHTSQRAELWAAIAALWASDKYAESGGQWPCEVPKGCKTPCRLSHLVIKSDSAYLVNSMTGAINKWKTNGWLTTKKTPVANRDLWELLLKRVAYLDKLGVTVEWWLVPRKENEEADCLANTGLRKKSLALRDILS